eukprot:EC121363.1.p1 GENE.EC121363.1~~EC121363.1.p1  ORF type:complete len:141 (+),score=1.77 EC121363.1:109-531(+)
MARLVQISVFRKDDNDQFSYEEAGLVFETDVDDTETFESFFHAYAVTRRIPEAELRFELGTAKPGLKCTMIDKYFTSTIKDLMSFYCTNRSHLILGVYVTSEPLRADPVQGGCCLGFFNLATPNFAFGRVISRIASHVSN